MYEIIKSSLGAAIGLVVAVVAIVGTLAFGWEWASGELLPTIIGVAVCGIAVILVARSVRD